MKKRKIVNEQMGFMERAKTGDHLFVMNVQLRKYTNIGKAIHVFVGPQKTY